MGGGERSLPLFPAFMVPQRDEATTQRKGEIRMHRTQIVAGNWKMHKNPRQAGEFVEALGVRLRERPDLAAPLAEDKVELALFPTALCLADAMRARREIPVTLGAQNAHWETHGAFTGEMGATMFADMGCGYILIGHSERRHLFHETEEDLARKLRAVLATSARCLFCVGELLEEREADCTQEVLRRQFCSATEGLTSEQMAEQVVLAYEPVWAIGTGRTASDEDAQEGCAFLRRLSAERFGDATAEKLRVLYGGSVKPSNTEGLMRQKDIDGLLVGGASLDVESFVAILEAAERTL